MEARYIKRVGSWRDVADCANTPIGREDGTREPSSSWKLRILLAEHSPIRSLWYHFKWTGLKYWVSVHLTRHKVGIEHYVKTQRSDRKGIDRDGLPQDARVDHRIVANAQAIINISRKRLCRNSSQETREAWLSLLETIRESDPEIYAACVPDCVYRGHCFEMESCGFWKSHRYKMARYEYVKGSGR